MSSYASDMGIEYKFLAPQIQLYNVFSILQPPIHVYWNNYVKFNFDKSYDCKNHKEYIKHQPQPWNGKQNLYSLP